MAIYDTIGRGYRAHRRPDPRIAAQVWEVLGEGSVCNVGAGTGSYEPADQPVIAVEPSPVMRSQRPAGSSPCVDAVAEALPFADGAFDAVLAVLTVHHWTDPLTGLGELRRVAGRRVVLTFDPSAHLDFWLIRDYLPEVVDLPGSNPPPPEVIAHRLGGGHVEVVPVPSDCLDGFLWASWARPHAYLDPSVRTAISALAQLPSHVVERGVAALAADLASGRWHERHGHLLQQAEVDGGFRLVVAGD